MVGIVAGNGLGLSTSSRAVLGKEGAQGDASFGIAGERISVNASNGNLVVQHTDEELAAIGPDLGLLRTYNSQGAADGDNNDGWRVSYYRQINGLEGGTNVSGSAICRVDGDGATSRYLFDDGRGLYVLSNGTGGDDTLQFDVVSNTWTWRDGDLPLNEVYEQDPAGGSNWRLTSVRDTDGNATRIIYNASGTIQRLESWAVGDASARETVYLDYGANKQLLQTRSSYRNGANVITRTLTRYAYDTLGRLSSVLTDTSPEDNTITDGRFHSITYEYDGTSTRLSRLVQGDGATVSITYSQIADRWLVRQVVDARGLVTNFAGDGATYVYVSTPSNATLLELDPSSGQLVYRASGNEYAHYSYDEEGNVSSITIGSETTSLGYNNGRMAWRQDAAGNRIERAYSVDGDLLCETAYATADPDGAGPAAASDPRKTYYVYDTKRHLRFVISPEGRVSEFLYDSFGQKRSSISYLGGCVSLTAQPDETKMLSLVSGLDRSKAERTDYSYDAYGGRLTSATHFKSIAADGTGVSDGTQTREQYVYDPYDRLLQVIDARGYVTTNTYDGLGRLLLTVDALGGTTTHHYDDVGDRVYTRRADGSCVVASYNAAGDLLATIDGIAAVAVWSQAFGTDTKGLNLPSSQISFDSAGQRLKLSTAATTSDTYPTAYGVRQYRFDSGMLFRSEITAPSVGTGQWFTIGADDAGVSGKNRYHYAILRDGVLNAAWGDGGPKEAALSSPAKPFKAGTTYVVDLETTDGGSVLYVYEKGTDRNTGFIDRRAYADWGVARMHFGTYGSSGRTARDLYVDNLSEYRINQSGSNLWREGFMSAPAGLSPLPSSNPLLVLESGRLRVDTVNAGLTADTTQAVVGRAVYAQSQSVLFKIDVLTSAASAGRYLRLGATNGASGAAARGHAALFSGGVLYARYLNSSGVEQLVALSTAAKPLKDNTKYTVEVQTSATGSTLYVYESGTSRSSGFSHTVSMADWGTASVEVTARGSSTTVSAPSYVTALQEIQGGSDGTTGAAVERFGYDANGNRRYVENGAGQRTRSIYSSNGRKVAEIDPAGEMQEWLYDANGRVFQHIRYANALSASQMSTLAAADGAAAPATNLLDAVRPTASISDRIDTTYYDRAGNISATIDAGGAVTTFEHDGLGHLTSQRRYATTVDVPEFSAKRTDSSAVWFQGFDRGLTGLTTAGYGATTAVAGGLMKMGLVTGSPSLPVAALNQVFGNRSYKSSDGLTVNFKGTVTTGASQAFIGISNRRTAPEDAPLQEYGLLVSSGKLYARYSSAGKTVVRALTPSIAGFVLKPTTTLTVYVALDIDTPDAEGGYLNVIASDGVGPSAQFTDFSDDVAPGWGEVGLDLSVSGLSLSGATLSADWIAEGVSGIDPCLRILPPESSDDRVVRTFYDKDGLDVGSLDAEGFLTEREYDAAGRLVSSTRYWNATRVGSRVSGTIDDLRPQKSDKDIRSIQIYDNLGRLDADIDAEGYLTRYGYDQDGRLTSTSRYAKPYTSTVSVDAASGAVRYLQATDVRLPTPLTDLGEVQVTRITYDKLARVVSKAAPDGTLTTYAYDAANRLIRSRLADNGGVDEPLKTQYEYDQGGHLIRELGYEGLYLLEQDSAAARAERKRLGYSEVLSALTSAEKTQLRDQYAIRYGYDGAGRLIAKRDGRNNRTLFYFDAAGRQTHTINADGNVSELIYDSFGGVIGTRSYAAKLSASALSGLAGGVVTPAFLSLIATLRNDDKDQFGASAFNTRGQQIQHTDAAGNATKFGYNAFGELSSSLVTLEATRTLNTVFTYDRRGLRVSTTQDPDGERVKNSTSYDAFGRVETATDARDVKRTTTYDKLGRTVVSSGPLGYQHTTAYDAFSRVLTQTDSLNNSVTYVHDTAARKVTMTTAEGVATITEYTRTGNVFRITDGNGGVTRYEYGPDGQLRSIIDPNNNVSTETRDVVGNLIETKDANGLTVRFEYDAFNRVVTKTTDPLGLNLATRYEYDGIGRTIAVTNPDGTVTRNEFNRLGQLSAVVRDATGFAIRTEFQYDAVGNTLRVTEAAGTAVAKLTEYSYDEFGRRVREVVDPAGLALATAYRYDSTGNLTERIDPLEQRTIYSYDAAGQLRFTIDATGSVRERQYDADGRVIADLRHATRLYPDSVASAAGLSATGSVDNIGYPAELVQRLVGSAVRSEVTHYVYDRDGRIHYVVDANMGVKRNEYDGLGNVVLTTEYAQPVSIRNFAADVAKLSALPSDSDDNRTHRFVFDKANRLVLEVDAEGYVSERRYDNGGRIISTTRFASRTSGLSADGVLSEDVVRAAITASEDDRTNYVVYDSAGRVKYEIDPERYITEYQYDDAGRERVRARYATPFALPPSIDATSIKALLPAVPTFGTLLVRSDYDRAGRLVDTTDAEGIVTHRVLDAQGRATSITVGFGRSDASSTDYCFDAAGRLTRITKAAGSSIAATCEYRYDACGRKIAEIGACGIALTESNSDWARRERAALGYAGDVSGLSDSQRQQLRDKYTTRYQYDALGRESLKVDALGGRVNTGYDAFGNIIMRDDALGRVTHFYYDRLNRLIATVSPDRLLHTVRYNAFGDVIERLGYDYPISVPLSERSDIMDGLAREQQVVGGGDAFTVTMRMDQPGARVLLEGVPGWAADSPGYGNWWFQIDPESESWEPDGDGYIYRARFSNTGNLYGDTNYVRTQIVPYGSGLGTVAIQEFKLESDNRGVLDYASSEEHLSVVSQHNSDGTWHKSIRRELGEAAKGETVTAYFKIRSDYGDAVPLPEFLVRSASTADGSEVRGAWSVVSEECQRMEIVGEADGWRSYALTLVVRDAGDLAIQFHADPAAAGLTTLDALRVASDSRGLISAADARDTLLLSSESSLQNLTSPLTLDLDGTYGGGGRSVEQSAYDRLGRLTKRNWGVDLEGGSAPSETYELDAFGQRWAVTNRLHGRAVYGFDKLGRMTSETLPVTVNGQSVVNNYRYDARGNRVGSDEAVGLAEQRTMTYEYDRLGRTTAKQWAPVAVFEGGVTSIVAPRETSTYDAQGNLIKHTDANGAVTLSYFDALGNKTAQIVEAEQRDGRAFGVLSTWEYDPAGNAIASTVYGQLVLMPSEGRGFEVPSAADARRTNYSFDSLGHQTKEWIDGVNLIGGFDADAKAEWFSRGTLESSKQYDAVGNVIRETDRNGASTVHFYDEMNREVITIDRENYVTYRTYGPFEVVTRRFARQMPVAVTPDTWSLERLKDYLEEGAGEGGFASGQDRVTVATLDELGRVKELRLLNVECSGTYEVANNFHVGHADAVTYYERDALGNVTLEQDPDGRTIEYKYDALGRMIERSGAEFTDYTGKGVRQREQIVYNGLGLVDRTVQLDDDDSTDVGDRVTRDAYDALGRLNAQVTAVGTTRYAYDAVGNRTLTVTTVRDAAEGLHERGERIDYDRRGLALKQMTVVGTAGCAYGDLVVSTQTEARYNAFGEVTGRRLNGGGADAAWQETADYDNVGRMWRSNTSGGATKLFVHDGNGNTTLTLDAASAMPDLDQAGLYRALTDTAYSSALADANRTWAVFDRRDQLVDTIQPNFTSREILKNLQEQSTSSALGNPVGAPSVDVVPAGGSVAPSDDASTAIGHVHLVSIPAAGFNLDFTVETRIENLSMVGADYMGLRYLGDANRYAKKIDVALPPISWYGDGQYEVEYSDTLGGTSTYLVGGSTSLMLSVPMNRRVGGNYTINIFKRVSGARELIASGSGKHPAAQRVETRTATPPVATLGLDVAMNPVSRREIELAGIPDSAATVTFFLKGADGIERPASAARKLVGGVTQPGWWALDIAGVSDGIYTFNYVALAADGTTKVATGGGALVLGPSGQRLVQSVTTARGIDVGGGEIASPALTSAGVTGYSSGMPIAASALLAERFERVYVAPGVPDDFVGSYSLDKLTLTVPSNLTTQSLLSGGGNYVVEVWCRGIRLGEAKVIDSATGRPAVDQAFNVDFDAADSKNLVSGATAEIRLFVDRAGIRKMVARTEFNAPTPRVFHYYGSPPAAVPVTVTPDLRSTGEQIEFALDLASRVVEYGPSYEGYPPKLGLAPDAARAYLNALDDVAGARSSGNRVWLTVISVDGAETVLGQKAVSASESVVDLDLDGLTTPASGSVKLRLELEAGGVRKTVAEAVYALPEKSYPSTFKGVAHTETMYSDLAGSHPSVVLTTSLAAVSAMRAYYRPAGSSGPYTLISSGSVGLPTYTFSGLDTAGKGARSTIAGSFAIDPSQLPSGNVEILYLGLGADGSINRVLERGRVILNLSGDLVTVQSRETETLKGNGYTLVDDSGYINFIDGVNGTLSASKATLSIKRSDAGPFATPETITLTKRALGAAAGGALSSGIADWFGWQPDARFSGLYDYELTTTTNDGQEVVHVGGQMRLGGTPEIITRAPISERANTIRFSNMAGASTLTVEYRLNGSTDPFVTSAPIPVASDGTAYWFSDALIGIAAGVHADDCAFDIKVTATNGAITVSTGTGTITLGKHASAGVMLEPVTLGTTRTIDTGVPSADRIVINYRLKPQHNTDDSYQDDKLLAPAFLKTELTGGGGRFEWDIAGLISPGVTQKYEILLEIYAGTTLLSKDDAMLTLTPGDKSTFRQEHVSGLSRLGDNVVIHRKQHWNAFGEVDLESDGRSNDTYLEYSTAGKLIRKTGPEVDVTSESGTVTHTATSTTYHYSLGGQQLGTVDANEHATGNEIAALDLYTGGQLLAQSANAAYRSKTYGYDVFGQLRYVIDELNRRTDYEYDNGGRLTRVLHPVREAFDYAAGFAHGDVRDTQAGSRAVENYEYDELGRRIAVTDTLGGRSTTFYDADGRIVRTVSAEARVTTYDYAYDATIKGLGGLRVGGWRKTTTTPSADAGGLARTQVEEADYFGHVTFKKDLGGHQFFYNYNRAGWLESQTGTSGQHIEYSYYANGYVASIRDIALGIETQYGYDKQGNRTYEANLDLTKIPGEAPTVYQAARTEYDAANRVTKFEDKDQATIEYSYDAVGNRRMMHAHYDNNVGGQWVDQTYWYAYDNMDRFTVTMGALIGGAIRAGENGVEISYDDAGQRRTALYGRASKQSEKSTWSSADGHLERYSYTSDGYLKAVEIVTDQSGTTTEEGWRAWLATHSETAAQLRAARDVDLAGRTQAYDEFALPTAGGGTYSSHTVSHYDKDGLVLSETREEDGKLVSATTHYYNENEDGSRGANDNLVDRVETVEYGYGGRDGTTRYVKTTTNTATRYSWWDSAQQAELRVKADSGEYKEWAPGQSKFEYNVNGHLTRVNDVAGKRAQIYINNAQGQILRRDELRDIGADQHLERWHKYFYLDGAVLGEVSNDGLSRRDYVQALAQRGPAPHPDKAHRNYTPIYAADFDQSYEPISPDYPGPVASHYTARAGDTLPQIALALWGDSAMWYLIADANGLSGQESLTEGQVLVIPNKVTNIHNNADTRRVYNPGEAIGDVQPNLPAPVAKENCGALAQMIMVVVAAVVSCFVGPAVFALLEGVIGVGAATLVAGAVGGAAASVASQGVGMAMGVQDKFSWKAVGQGALVGAITAGINGMPGTPFAEAGGFAGEVFNISKGFVTGAVNAATSAGLSMALQGKWNWKTVASAAAGGAVGSAVGGSGFSGGLVGGFTSGFVSQLVGRGQVDPTSLFISTVASAVSASASSSSGSTAPVSDVRSSGSGLQANSESFGPRFASENDPSPYSLTRTDYSLVDRGAAGRLDSGWAAQTTQPVDVNALPANLADLPGVMRYPDGSPVLLADNNFGVGLSTDTIPVDRIVVTGTRSTNESMLYSGGSGRPIRVSETGDGSTVEYFADGYSEQGPQDDAPHFVARDMAPFGADVSRQEYGRISQRAADITWDYDTPGFMHELKDSLYGLFGGKADPIRTPALERERADLLGILATANSAEANNPMYVQVDAARGGIFGAGAVIYTRNSSPRDQIHAATAFGHLDNATMAFASAKVASAEISALKSFGNQGRIGVFEQGAPNRGARQFSGGAPSLEGSVYNADVVNARSADFYRLYGDNPARGTMSNVEARQWYLAQDAQILNRIDSSASLESQARQAFDLRNANRTQAREFMSDRVTADRLIREEPNMTWNQMLEYQRRNKGLTGDDAYRSILQSSKKTRASVNKQLGVE
ncbi:DUF6531 domain-containing protein [Niveibacterium sp. COAC-50]|uniref:DUF6531 domain-containing protein n=1 Tax=Niveibacterium sp. COAC-50 TaxID=2729384 RepID=UPI001553A6AD|nr:DUF6531 domain-containing protein [Niveibacterium sp. COAC-50]